MTGRVDILNIGLIVLSFILAFYLPFELFLWAYAVLGPLHYITEINWLEKKDFFVKDRKLIWLLVGLCLLIVSPFILAVFPYFNGESPQSFIQKVHYFVWDNVAVLILCSLVVAITMTFSKKLSIVLLAATVSLTIGFALAKNYYFMLFFGLLLASIIHVYLFTALFMLYGVLKKPGAWGYISVVLILLVPLVLIFLPVDPSIYDPSKEVIDNTTGAGMNRLKMHLANLFGVMEEGKPFGILSVVGYKLQIFISFAYLYHYLNWFSKTTVIGWHKVITVKKFFLLSAIWILSLVIYYYDYLIGFTVLLSLSFLHVILEFPLNAVSVRTIFMTLFGKKA